MHVSNEYHDNNTGYMYLQPEVSLKVTVLLRKRVHNYSFTYNDTQYVSLLAPVSSL